ncbi:hypothetical protein Lesp02_85390 [Lentzea sp. NBRC 105346]|uniref:hypothetical protein n=1 Tax=Lentzea sp. NBRC 105346 TaxID=3032205 RepID=UPI0024A0A319|nr:hypothetical protein [Lentzea sp. NBRC 105346]GLZ36352.1 hypothetical protein Lesp02_85390 [Lentzea sp. NBRC 105346]
MSTEKTPNRKLAAVMTQAGISNKGLAARVRELAARDGHEIAADHVAVRRWLDGGGARVRTAEYVARALGAKLGRPVSLSEIGFDAARTAGEVDILQAGVQYPTDSGRSVELLDKLADADLADSPAVMASGWDALAAPGIITGYMFGASTVETPSLVVAGPGAVERIRAVTAHFTDIDFQFGGGQVRRMMLFYFKTEIVPLLRQSQPDAIRRQIFSAAAEVAGLLGWSAYDAGRHGAAQRYFVQGLRLAREANDRAYGAYLLSNLSHQANYLGRFSDAVQLARAAQSAAVGTGVPAAMSSYFAMEARALANLGDERGCSDALRRSETEFAQRTPDSDRPWITYFDEFELAGEAAHCFRDLGRAGEARSFASQAVDVVQTPARTQAFIRMVDAVAALKAGDLEESLSLATGAVHLTGALQSSRYLRYLSDFRTMLAGREVGNSAVRSFLDLTSPGDDVN